MTTFLHRVTGAALLNPAIYEEVEADRTATMQAMAVVALSSLAAGVGALGLASVRVTALAGISLLAFAVWVIWAVLTSRSGPVFFLHRARRRTSVNCFARSASRRRQASFGSPASFQARRRSCSPSRPSGCSWR